MRAGNLPIQTLVIPRQTTGLIFINNKNKSLQIYTFSKTVIKHLCMKRIFALLVLSISYTVALAQIVTGSYTGNGTSQNITAPGFQPDIVIIKRAGSTGTAQHGQVRIAGMSTTMDMSSTTSATDRITGFLSNGFSVGSGASVNTSGDVFYYLAIKNKSGEIATGSYTGNGIDNTNICLLYTSRCV